MRSTTRNYCLPSVVCATLLLVLGCGPRDAASLKDLEFEATNIGTIRINNRVLPSANQGCIVRLHLNRRESEGAVPRAEEFSVELKNSDGTTIAAEPIEKKGALSESSYKGFRSELEFPFKSIPSVESVRSLRIRYKGSEVEAKRK